MPNPQELLDFARSLSIQGVEDLHIRLLSRQSNAKKALIQLIEELVDVSVEAQIIGLLRGARTSPKKPGLMRAKATSQRRIA